MCYLTQRVEILAAIDRNKMTGEERFELLTHMPIAKHDDLGRGPLEGTEWSEGQAAQYIASVDAQFAALNADQNRRSEAEWQRVFQDMERLFSYVIKAEFVRNDAQCQQHIYDLSRAGSLEEFNHVLDRFHLYLKQIILGPEVAQQEQTASAAIHAKPAISNLNELGLVHGEPCGTSASLGPSARARVRIG